MNRNNLIGWIFLVICTIAAPLHAQNSVKVKGAQGRWQVSEEITLKEAEERAFMEAKKEALRKAGVMENVWSVFGQISQESGTEFHEAYSQMNVLAIGGMVNVTNKKVEEVWDTNTRSLYKVVTIDAVVQKEEKVDKSYALEVKGVANLYKEGDVFTCTLKVHGTDSYLKFSGLIVPAAHCSTLILTSPTPCCRPKRSTVFLSAMRWTTVWKSKEKKVRKST